MQNICILISTLIMSIHIKSVRCILIGENQPESDYRLGLRPLSISRDTSTSLNDDDSWLDTYKNDGGQISTSPEEHVGLLNSITENTDNKYSTFRTYSNDDAVRLLLNTYSDLLRKNSRSSYDEDKDVDTPVTYEKRALTMLSRWKPFRIPNSIGGNGRHVIRSPFISRSDPSNALSKMQIMGRPFRWG